jgi:hypothetical protein
MATAGSGHRHNLASEKFVPELGLAIQLQVLRLG